MLILTLLVATLIVVICFICLLYFVANVLDKQYIITSFDNDNNYQIAHVNIIEYYNEKSNYIVDERKYLNITFVSFTLFILYVFVQNINNSKKFFDNYFEKNYDTIVY